MTAVLSLSSRAVLWALRWGVPAALLITLALVDGLVRTAALGVLALAATARLLIVALERAREHAPTGPLAIPRVRVRGDAA